MVLAFISESMFRLAANDLQSVNSKRQRCHASSQNLIHVIQGLHYRSFSQPS